MEFGRLACRVAVLGAALGALLVPAAGRAHPHVWIDSVTTFVFEDGQLVALRHRWQFDEFFGSFVIEEHDADGDGAFDAAELASLEAAAFAALEEYGYFTHLRTDGTGRRLDEVREFTAEIEDGELTYDFTLALPAPLDPAAVAIEVGVYDPDYYVEVLLDAHDPVRFAGLPSGACTFEIREDTANPIYFGMVYPLAIALRCGTS